MLLCQAEPSHFLVLPAPQRGNTPACPLWKGRDGLWEASATGWGTAGPDGHGRGCGWGLGSGCLRLPARRSLPSPSAAGADPGPLSPTLPTAMTPKRPRGPSPSLPRQLRGGGGSAASPSRERRASDAVSGCHGRWACGRRGVRGGGRPL